MKNGHKRTQIPMPSRTNSEVQRLEKDIRTLRDSGRSDFEIRQTLKIEERTYRRYRRYIRKIHLDDERVWFSITQEQLDLELLRLKSSLEETYRISLAMAKDPKYEDRLSVLLAKDDARMNVVKLLREIPEFIRNIPISQPDEQDSTTKNKLSTFKRLHS
jgi:hypothetical protein